ncbi:hypothetical protein [Hansschlegelia zhihuaiae]|uniref:hypothetical protein n=1 Tax=Hansschlegelia zhihuaiae TaxID=405005 RepID=UPI0013E8EB7A|nr:hypothetical protein [Hansschlegelia zhihuaiae]
MAETSADSGQGLGRKSKFKADPSKYLEGRKHDRYDTPEGTVFTCAMLLVV